MNPTHPHNRIISIGVVIVAVVLAILGMFFFLRTGSVSVTMAERLEVINLVESFGGKLQAVSLLAPHDALTAAIDDQYADFVTPELLAKWENDPAHAPGRTVSSPWPDRIEIKSLTEDHDDSYIVAGTVIEMTSEEATHGGNAGSYPVTITVQKFDDGWRITDFEKSSQ